MNYLDLVGSVGQDQENEAADIKNTAASLAELGIGRMDRAGQTGAWDGDFDSGVRDYQASNGLEVDGILLPGGPTQRRINDTLEDSGGAQAERHEAVWDDAFASGPSLGQNVSLSPRLAASDGRGGLRASSLLTREDELIARGYRYRPDPMGRLGEGDWFDRR